MSRLTPLLAVVVMAALPAAALVRGGEAEEGGLEEAIQAVESATQRHLEALRDLLGEVPEEARPAVEHAMNVSKHGRNTALEAVELARAAGPRQRAMLHWRHAERRIAEIEGMKGGRPEFVETLARDYRRSAQGALLDLEEARKQGAGVEEALEAVHAGTQKHQEVLRGVLEKVPDEARPGILRAIEASSRGRQAALRALGRAPAGPPGAGSARQAGPPAGIRRGPPEDVGPPAGAGREEDDERKGGPPQSQRRGGPPAGRGRRGRP